MNDYTPTIPRDWDDRAEELREKTLLTKREAEVRALTEAGCSREEIADVLDISIYTVDEHRQAFKRRLRRARETAEEFQDVSA